MPRRGREPFAEKNYLQSFGFSQYSRQALNAAPAGGDAQIDFGKADDRFGIIGHQTEMAG